MTWWHDKTSSELFAIRGDPLVASEFPSQSTSYVELFCFFVVASSKLLNKQSRQYEAHVGMKFCDNQESESNGIITHDRKMKVFRGNAVHNRATKSRLINITDQNEPNNCLITYIITDKVFKNGDRQLWQATIETSIVFIKYSNISPWASII